MVLVHSNDKLHFLWWLARQNPVRVIPKMLNYIHYSLGTKGPKLNYRPIGIGAAVTERCNMSCDCCYWKPKLEEGFNLKSTDLDLNNFKKVLERFGKSAVHCSFTGGEPLLHSDILRLIEMAAAQPLYTSLFTNGRLLDRFEEQLLESGLSVLNISPHSLEEHPELAQDPELINNDKVLSNISHFSARRSSRRIRTSIAVMVTRSTYPYMKDIIKIGEVLGVDVVRLMSVLPFEKQSFDTLVSWDDEEFKSYFRNEILPLRPSVDVVMPKYYEEGAPQRTCQELFVYLKFSVSGDVYPCCYLPLEQKYGKSFLESFDWNNSALQKARARMLDGNKFYKYCTFCAHVSTRNIQYNRTLQRWTGSIKFK